jgi:hypothetical protein
LKQTAEKKASRKLKKGERYEKNRKKLEMWSWNEILILLEVSGKFKKDLKLQRIQLSLTQIANETKTFLANRMKGELKWKIVECGYLLWLHFMMRNCKEKQMKIQKYAEKVGICCFLDSMNEFLENWLCSWSYAAVSLENSFHVSRFVSPSGRLIVMKIILSYVVDSLWLRANKQFRMSHNFPMNTTSIVTKSNCFNFCATFHVPLLNGWRKKSCKRVLWTNIASNQ